MKGFGIISLGTTEVVLNHGIITYVLFMDGIGNDSVRVVDTYRSVHVSEGRNVAAMCVQLFLESDERAFTKCSALTSSAAALRLYLHNSVRIRVIANNVTYYLPISLARDILLILVEA